MGQDYSVTNGCTAKDAGFTAAKCAIEFDPSGQVKSFGGIQRGQFEGDPDIAGQGVLLAFLIPGCIVCFLGIVFVLIRAWSFKTLRKKLGKDL